MIKFEKISQYENIELAMPERKTELSAGYDFVVAEDTIIPPYRELLAQMRTKNTPHKNSYTLEEVSALTKNNKTRPTLVPTGMKCALEPGYYLELSVRSSSPLKNWIILANGVGIIDADYYNNPDNEGHIYFQLINLSPYYIQLKRGDIIGQGIIKTYEVTDNDKATGTRTGGFGSTTIAYSNPPKATKPDVEFETAIFDEDALEQLLNEAAELTLSRKMANV